MGKGKVTLPLLVFTFVMNITGAMLYRTTTMDIASSAMVATVIGAVPSVALYVLEGTDIIASVSTALTGMLERYRLSEVFAVGALIGFNIAGTVCMAALGTELVTGMVSSVVTGAVCGTVLHVLSIGHRTSRS
ncbi:MAG: hypothetical protein MJZ68_05690 [archaeon]|nr:hypothetical protein [archaeon]